MKFKSIISYPQYSISDKDDFDVSLLAEVDTKMEVAWDKLVYVFGDKYEKEDLDDIHELYYFLEGSATHLEVINDNVNLYEIDDMKCVLIDTADGSIGVGIVKENKSNFEKMY